MGKRLSNEDFIKKANIKHNNKYDYSETKYIDSTTPVNIICPIHGLFKQVPADHLRGCGCPKCANMKRGDTFRDTANKFIEQAEKIHNGKYDYSKVEYVNSSTKVCIICPEHGEFWQTPSRHLLGQGCPKCSGRGLTTKEIIKKFREKHGDEYDYSKVIYHKMHEKVTIICKKHGEFKQTPSKHLLGHGCPICAEENKNKTRKISVEQFIKRSRIIHGDKYSYDNIKIEKNLHDKIELTCPIHGKFETIAADHLLGHGCPKCAIDKSKMTFNEFVKKAKEIHNDKYDYSQVQWKDTRSKIEIICPVHGVFSQVAYTHLKGCGCPKCGHIISKNENEIYEYVCGLIGKENVDQGNRSILNNNHEIDIYIPSLKVGIEYNGIMWHSEKFNKDKNYHLNKLNECNEKGIKLIQVFEDEYIEHKEIVLSKIRHILGFDKNLSKVYARKCTVLPITVSKAKDFLKENHIQGFANSTIHVSASYNNEIVGVMSFKRLNKSKNDWELTRFATINNKLCVGIGGKLFNWFLNKYHPDTIKSFADRRWTLNENNNLYVKLGFYLDEIEKPDYRYVKSGNYKRIHKFNFRKQRLHDKFGFPLTMTETQMANEVNAYKIWDCGLLKYVWKRENI